MWAHILHDNIEIAKDLRRLPKSDHAPDGAPEKGNVPAAIFLRNRYAEWNQWSLNDGIDSIDDTLYMIAELKSKGYPDQQLRYLELADGKHDIATCARAMPEFLSWCFQN